jgi:ATP-dependent HslUV protease subunit HslV
MSTIVVAKKNGEAAIAADTLSSMGGTKLSAAHKVRAEKILKFQETYLGFVGYAVHREVFESITEKNPRKLVFSSRRHIFETFLKVHAILKKKFFLNASNDAPYESSDMCILLANPSGIFQVTPNRTVTEYQCFWATGSGSDYALGAMHHAYPKAETAREVAIAGVLAAAEFDLHTGLPYSIHVLTLREKPEMKTNGSNQARVENLRNIEER